MASASKTFIMAIDAGGTSTKALFTTLSGTDLATASSRPFNLRQRDRDRFRKIMIDLFSKLMDDIQEVGLVPDAVMIGVAGAGDKEDRAELKDVIENRWQRSLVRIHHDAFIAHYGAFEGGPGVIVTSGTGSIAFGKNAAGEEIRAGGWGWLLGDEGSAWWIGREALRSVLSMKEGGRETSLSEPILSQLKINDPYEILSVVYKDRFERGSVSNLSELVFVAAGAGDEVALDILRQAGRELGKIAVMVARRLSIPARDLEVALMGGVGVGAFEYMKDGLTEILNEYDPSDTALVQVSEQVNDMQSLEALPEGYRKNVSKVAQSLMDGTMDQSGELDAARQNRSKDSDTHQVVHDVLMEKETGPLLIHPRMDALHGAAQWGRDLLLKRKFA